MIDRTGQQLGNYRLIRSLGSGGFADVYLGEHIYLNTQAAIKILQARLTQNDLQAFLTEARTIANLTHRNIVQVLDFGVQGTTPFLVMTYAPNGTLRQRHPNGTRLSLSEVNSYIRQVAPALQYAHDRKVTHRDVKPENMLIGQNGDILLSDFGIAVVTQSSRPNSQEVGGTVAYMAPEQLQGNASPASDQYALAVVVYEWLTGERPFNGSFAEIGSQHLFTPPAPLRAKVPTIPPAVEQVIQTALSKNPQQRFQSVQAFANALEQASGVSQGLPLMPPSPYDAMTQADQERIATEVKKPSSPAYAQFGNMPSGNFPPRGNMPSGNFPPYNPTPQPQPDNAAVPPPPPGYTIHNYNAPMNTPRFPASEPPPINPNMQSGQFPNLQSGQFSPPAPAAAPRQEKKSGGNRGFIIAIVALIILLVAAGGIGGGYLLANRGTSSSVGQATATTPQGTVAPTATSASTDTPTPTPQDTATTVPTATPTVAATASTSSTWGPNTKNQKLVCVSSCDGNIDVTLNNLSIDDSRNTMVWNFTITDNGQACTYMYGKVYLEDPAGTKLETSGGTFDDQFTINAGQALPKTAVFTSAPRAGVLYEVHLTMGCYGSGTYQIEHFKR